MMPRRYMPFGWEQFLLETNPVLRALGPLVGELHYGLKVRALYLSAVLERLPADHYHRILDAGCGKGQTAFWLSRRFPQALIHGVDVNPELIEHCKKIAGVLNAHSLQFFVADLVSYRREEVYDLIICFDVLEHIPDWVSVLRNLVDSLKPAGHLLVHVPHKSKYLGPSFGLRRILSRSLISEKNPSAEGAIHVRDGFRQKDFCILEKWDVQYSVRYTFGPLAMHLHTIFEAYRGFRRYWHLFMTPILSTLALVDVKRQLHDGGGLLIQITKSV